MGSTCGSTLSLMDAGVPIKAPVAGVAMGLITASGETLDKYAILTDIQGLEDAMGDMDFKVAGTADGVTALQMDIKIKGLTPEVLAQAMEQARAGRMFIMDRMLETLPEPRAQLSPHAPRISESLSNCRALLSMATFAAYLRKLSGSRGEYQTVRFGSGPGPRL